MKKIITVPDSYECPKIVVVAIENEGILCDSTSGNHKGFTESDDWMDLIEEE